MYTASDGIRHDATKAAERLMPYIALLWFVVLLIWMLGKVPSLDFYLNSGDNGYLLTQSQQVLAGRFPSVDIISHYGPLVVFTSVLGLLIHKSLIPETLICVAGYTAALWLIYRLVCRHAPTRKPLAEILGMVASVVALYECARFYKWYYWLFPLAAIAILSVFARPGAAVSRRVQRLCALGVLAGIAGLYRLDLGAAVFGASCLSLFLLRDGRPIRWKLIQDGMVLAAGAVVPFLVWFAVLIGVGGGTVGGYFESYFSGAANSLERLRHPLPRFDPSAPFSPESAHCILMILMIGSYVAVLAPAALARLRSHAVESPHARFLAVVAAFGLALYPQSLHLVNIGHSLQVIPPFLIMVFVGCPYLWTHSAVSPRRPGPSVLARRITVAGVVGLLIGVLVGFSGTYHRWWGRDLEPFGERLGARYAGLYQGPRLSEGRAESDMAKFISIVRRLCPQDATYMPLGYIWISYLLDRRGSGLFPFHMKGLYDSPDWLARDIAQVQSDAPVVVVTFRHLKDVLLSDIPTLNAGAEGDAEEEIAANRQRWMLIHLQREQSIAQVERLGPQLEYVRNHFVYDESLQIPGFPYVVLTRPDSER